MSEKNQEATLTSELTVDVFQCGQKLIILAPIPGVNKEEMNIHIEDDLLTLSGHRSFPDKTPSQNIFHQECFWGDFKRSIIIPLQVDAQNAEAFYKRGMLRIELPILKTERSRVIPITISDE